MSERDELRRLLDAAADTPSEAYAAMRNDPRAVKLADAAEAVQSRGKGAYNQVIERVFDGGSIT